MNTEMSPLGKFLLLCLLPILLTLQSCSIYRSKPLPERVEPAASIIDLQSQVPDTSLLKSRDFSQGIALVDLAGLAAYSNPSLKAKRYALRISQAQKFSDSLLPDPQLSYGVDKPSGSDPSLVDGWLRGIDFDLSPLLQWFSRHHSAEAAVAQAKLELNWEEWQVIQQAQILGAQYLFEQRRIRLLKTAQQRFQQHYQHSLKGLQRGNLTLDTNASDLSALLDSQSTLGQWQRQRLQTRAELCTLLGLSLDAKLNIYELNDKSILKIKNLSARVNRLSELRPDLLALRAGYESQEYKLKSEVLAQFPSVSVGVNRASDTSDVRTRGISISINLPIFNANRGAIAVASATRDQLRQEYRSRVLQSESEVEQLLRLNELLQRQESELQNYLPILNRLAKRAREAYERGDMQALSYLNIESTHLNKQLELIDMQEQLWQTQVGLQTLLMLPSSVQVPESTFAPSE